MSTETYAVLGAGSWGTAIAKLLADQGHRTRLWARRPEQAADIEQRRDNATYLPGVDLPDTLEATSDLGHALRDARMVVCVVPTHGVRQVLSDALPHFGEDVPIVSATKGIENDTLMLVSDIFREVLPPERHRWLVYLGGPSFAKEVAANMPTAVSVAGSDQEVATQVQSAFTTDRFRAYITEDEIGVELGGALKNVIAIATGISDGLGFGHNARAALVTRGLAEISRLALELGANPLTMAGLSGLGDLVLTCTGDLSRNRGVGLQLGRGKSLEEVLGGMSMVAEGVRTTRSTHELAQREQVEMPITKEVYHVLYERKPPIDAVVSLMGRPLKHERQ